MRILRDTWYLFLNPDHAAPPIQRSKLKGNGVVERRKNGSHRTNGLGFAENARIVPVYDLIDCRPEYCWSLDLLLGGWRLGSTSD